MYILRKMIASRILTPVRVQAVNKSAYQKSRGMVVCQMNKGDPPKNPYELFDSTVKLVSSPATAPLVEEMKRTNEALYKIVDILEEYKLRTLYGLVPTEQSVDNKPVDK